MTQSQSLQTISRRILIACIGNIFFGDDGFGVEVAQRLLNRKTRRYPNNVRVIDFGISGIELAYTLLDNYETVVLVDAVPRGGPPGTLYLIEPDPISTNPPQSMPSNQVVPDGHSMDPLKVLAFARTLGAPPTRILLIGCEPSKADYEEMQMGLSEPVLASIDDAVKMIDSVVEELLSVNS